MMRRTIVAFVGISGVGKSTVLKEARNRIPFEHLQASELIRAEHARQRNNPTDHNRLREVNIRDNQALLVAGFRYAAPKEGLIVLDGHTVIDTPHGLAEISPAIFQELEVDRFIALVDDAERIALRRLSDQSRSRPSRSAEHLREQQERSIMVAYQAALILNVPLVVLPVRRSEDIIGLLRN